MGFFPLTKFFLFLDMETPGTLSRTLSLSLSFCLSLSFSLSIPTLSPSPTLGHWGCINSPRSYSHRDPWRFALKPQNVLTALQFGYWMPLPALGPKFPLFWHLGFSFWPVRRAPSIFPFDFAVPSPLEKLSPLPRNCRKPAKHHTRTSPHPPQITPLESSRLEHHAVKKVDVCYTSPHPSSPVREGSVVKWMKKLRHGQGVPTTL